MAKLNLSSILKKIVKITKTSDIRELREILKEIMSNTDAREFLQIIERIYLEKNVNKRNLCAALSELGGSLDLWDPKVKAISDFLAKNCDYAFLIDYKVWLKHGIVIRHRLCDVTFFEICGPEITYLFETLLNKEFSINSRFFRYIELGLTLQEIQLGRKLGKIFSKIINNVDTKILEATELLRIKLERLGLSFRNDFYKALMEITSRVEWGLKFENALIFSYVISFLHKLNFNDMERLLVKLSRDPESIRGMAYGFALSMFRHFLSIRDPSIPPAISEILPVLSELTGMNSQDWLDIINALQRYSLEYVASHLILNIINFVFDKADTNHREILLETLHSKATQLPRQTLSILKNLISKDIDDNSLSKIFDILLILIRKKKNLERDVASIIRDVEYYVDPRVANRFLAVKQNIVKLLSLIAYSDDPQVTLEVTRFIKMFSLTKLISARESKEPTYENQQLHILIQTAKRKISNYLGEPDANLVLSLLGVEKI